MISPSREIDSFISFRFLSLPSIGPSTNFHQWKRSASAVKASGEIRDGSSNPAFRRNHTNVKAPLRLLPSLKGWFLTTKYRRRATFSSSVGYASSPKTDCMTLPTIPKKDPDPAGISFLRLRRFLERFPDSFRCATDRPYALSRCSAGAS